MTGDKNVQINPDGIDKVFAQIAAKIEQVDRDIRAEHTGQPADQVAQVASQRFAAAGVNLTPTAILDYAASVEDGEPFTIGLQ
jgi:hypothetical protein